MLSVSGATPSFCAMTLFKLLRRSRCRLSQQEANAILPAFPSWILEDTGDRPADSIMFQNQFESLSRMDLLLVGNLDDAGHILVLFRALDGGYDWSGFSNGPEIRPGPGNVVRAQKQLAGFACSLNKSLLVLRPLVRRHLLTGPVLNQWQSKLKPFPEDAQLKKLCVVLVLHERLGENIKHRLFPSRLQRALGLL